MAASRIQQLSANGATPVTSAAFGSSTTTGNMIIVSISVNDAINAVTGVTDAKGNTYTRAVARARLNNLIENEIWYAENITGGASHTVTVTTNTGKRAAFIAEEWSGMVTSGSIDKTSSGNGNNSVLTTATTVSLGTDSSLVIGSFASDNSFTYTAGSGYSNLTYKQDTNSSVAMESKTISVFGGQTATATMSGSSDYAATVAVFKVAGGNVANSSRSNLIVNPNFETNITDGWGSSNYNGNSNLVVTRDTTEFHGGAASMKFTAAISVDDGRKLTITNLPAGTYYLSCWQKLVGTVANGHFVIRAGSPLVQINSAGTNVGWTRIGGSFTIGSTTTVEILVGLGSYGAGSTGTVYIDEVMLETGSTLLTFFDGDTPDTGTLIYDWAGTPGNSISTEVTLSGGTADPKRAEMFEAFF